MIQSANGLGPQTIGRYSVSAHLSPPFLPPKTHCHPTCASFFFFVLFGLNKKNQKEVLFVFLFGCPFITYIYIYTQNVGPPNSQKTPVGDPDEMKDRPLSGLVGLR